MKKSFVLYTSYLEQIRLLSNEQAGVLFKAILAYEAGKKELIPEMDDLTNMAFSFIRYALDENAGKYVKVCEKRGGAFSETETAPKPDVPLEKSHNYECFSEDEDSERQKKQMVSSGKQKKQMVFLENENNISCDCVSDNDNEYDNDKEYDNDSVTDHEKEDVLADTEEKDEREAAFDKFWELYPKKKSKGQARTAWKKVKPENYEAIMTKLPELTASPEWKREDGRFIPYPSTWLNAEGWEDEPGRKETDQRSIKNSFCNFDQRSYDYDELERVLLTRNG